MKTPCKYPGCNQVLASSGYCEKHKDKAPDHRKNYEIKRSRDPVLSLAARIRSTARWKRVSRHKLALNPLCEDPHGDHGSNTRTAEQVHHVEGLATRPDLAFHLDNLMSVCVRCHAKIEAQVRKESSDNAI